MALKPSICDYSYDVSYWFTRLAERGGIASLNKDQPYSEKGMFAVSYNTNVCQPVGMLLNDVINIDLCKTPLYNAVYQRSKVYLAKTGAFITDQIVGDPQPGNIGILYQNGQILVWDYPKLPKSMRRYYVGKFLTKKDQDGFAKFSVEIV